jgi:protein SCO1
MANGRPSDGPNFRRAPMNRPATRIEWLVWIGLILTVASIVIAFLIGQTRRQKQPTLDVLFQVPDFTLTNQAGQPFGSANLRGHVWLAEIIFTKCAGPCPRMTERMAQLQAAIPPDKAVRFVTLTTDPEYDTPSVLDAYSRRFKAQPERWHFLTGTKQQIADVAVRGLKLTALEKEMAERENPNDLFIHSTLFVIVDKRGKARAVIETEPSEGEAPPEVKTAVLPIIDRLLKEP